MAGLRFADLQSRPTEFLDFTSLTLDEFQQLVPPFDVAFQAHMAARRTLRLRALVPLVCSRSSRNALIHGASRSSRGTFPFFRSTGEKRRMSKLKTQRS
jgi:hypothetical protein